MRWLTAGESHGQALSAIIEGIPASVIITTADIDRHRAQTPWLWTRSSTKF